VNGAEIGHAPDRLTRRPAIAKREFRRAFNSIAEPAVAARLGYCLSPMQGLPPLVVCGSDGGR
jgi:hypothetical protein